MQISEQPADGGIGSGSDQSIRTLLNDVDEFLNYIAIVKTPEVDAVRPRLERSLGAAKHALLNAVARTRRKASGRVSIRSFSGNSWALVAAAALFGAWFGKAIHTRARRHSVR